MSWQVGDLVRFCDVTFDSFDDLYGVIVERVFIQGEMFWKVVWLDGSITKEREINGNAVKNLSREYALGSR